MSYAAYLASEGGKGFIEESIASLKKELRRH
jgi:hypothetical protein